MNYFQVRHSVAQLHHVLPAQSDALDHHVRAGGTIHISTFLRDEFVFRKSSDCSLLTGQETLNKLTDVFGVRGNLIFPPEIAPQGMERLKKIRKIVLRRDDFSEQRGSSSVEIFV